MFIPPLFGLLSRTRWARAALTAQCSVDAMSSSTSVTTCFGDPCPGHTRSCYPLVPIYSHRLGCKVSFLQGSASTRGGIVRPRAVLDPCRRNCVRKSVLAYVYGSKHAVGRARESFNWAVLGMRVGSLSRGAPLPLNSTIMVLVGLPGRCPCPAAQGVLEPSAPHHFLPKRHCNAQEICNK